MLDPMVAGKIWDEHFATVTREEFVARFRAANPELARELWGDRSFAEICARPPRRLGRARGVFASLGRSVLRLFS